ncbi:helix-turn-helix domain-containing protein, partial [Pseudophaeobacter sp.]|uniref:helix-turn-helix domain-containing protein n=1 Tax=Pseudophaeobacter sp. TaxID=1971739 RepID=UPI0032979B9D
MGEMGHSVEATTKMTLCVFDRAFSLTWLAGIEEHFLSEAVSTLTPRTALQGVAWALVRVFLRGKPLRIERGGRMEFPFKQQDLADALGLSLVHTSKTLGILRKRQMAQWTEGELRVSDLQ